MYEYAKRRSSTVTAVQKHRDSIISYQDIAKFRETAKILSKSAKIYQRQRYEKRLKYDNRFTLSNGTPNFFYETSCRIVILLQDVEVFREKCQKAGVPPAPKDFRKAQCSIWRFCSQIRNPKSGFPIFGNPKKVQFWGAALCASKAKNQ